MQNAKLGTRVNKESTVLSVLYLVKALLKLQHCIFTGILNFKKLLCNNHKCKISVQIMKVLSTCMYF